MKLKIGEEIADRICSVIDVSPVNIEKLYNDLKNNVTINTLKIIEKLLNRFEKEKERKSSGKLNVSI